jgi:Protein of unknown function (DUF3795)
MKTKNSAEELIAPCGMNCALCSGYLALKNDVKNQGVQIPYCHGCRPRDKKCAFLKKRCSQLLTHEVNFCYECKDFPCENLKHIDMRYQKFYKMSFIENLLSIEKNGVDRFFSTQKKKWKCPTCDGFLCCHNGLCFHCDIDTLKKKKKKYRWEDE